jgi:ribose transport system permease protein
MATEIDIYSKLKFSNLMSLSGATGPLIGLIALCLFLTFSTDTFFNSTKLVKYS